MATGSRHRILLVEDDYLQEDAITTELKESLPGVQIESVATESDFLARLERIERSDEPAPDLIILDYMIRWAWPNPGNTPQPPAEWEDEGPFLAGTRCERRIKHSSKLARTPAIIFTVLAEDVLREHPVSRANLTFYLRKDHDLRPLCKLVRRLLDFTA